jgi:hypothetical protein
MSEQIEQPSDLEAVARALCQYEAVEIHEASVDEMWAAHGEDYMRAAETALGVLAPLFASKREAGYQAGYLDGMAKSWADATTTLSGVEKTAWLFAEYRHLQKQIKDDNHLMSLYKSIYGNNFELNPQSVLINNKRYVLEN